MVDYMAKARAAVRKGLWREADFEAFCERSGKRLADGWKAEAADVEAWFDTACDVDEREKGKES